MSQSQHRYAENYTSKCSQCYIAGCAWRRPEATPPNAEPDALHPAIETSELARCLRYAVTYIAQDWKTLSAFDLPPEHTQPTGYEFYQFDMNIQEEGINVNFPRRSRRHNSSILALGFLAAFAASPAYATDIPMDPSVTAGAVDTSESDRPMGEHSNHGKSPAGVYSSEMIGTGKIMFSYTPMFMHMEDNYIGSSTVSPQTIVTTIPSKILMMGGMPEKYRIVPTSMDSQTHMFHAMYGVNDWLNLMVMASYQKKTMKMTTYAGAAGTTILGTSSASSEGIGDTSVVSLLRLYKGPTQDMHLNLGLSLPSGSTTQSMTMLSPMNKSTTMRASYGMQLGTGTVDLLPGATYTGHKNDWSWGAAWHSRLALNDNSEGYHYGYLHEFTGWGGYTWVPGVTTTARITEAIQGRIHGSDPMISGLMQGTNPSFYGGEHTDLLGGIEIDGAHFGLRNTHLAVEAGGTVFQDLNGPQLGRSWQLNAALGMGF